MPRPALNDSQKAARRRALLDAARRLFQTTPLDALRVAAVAREAGLAKGTVYLYFETKEALFLALLNDAFAGWFDAVDAGLDAAPTPWDADGVVDLVGRTLEAHPDLPRLIAILHTVLERNVTAEAALDFKTRLRDRMLTTGARLERALPFLGPGGGAQTLLRLHALVIGFQHMAAPAPVVAEILRRDDMRLLDVQFPADLLTTLRTLLRGLETD